MRQKFLTKFLWAFSIFLILPTQELKALTLWHNNPAIAASVTDDDIDVQGLNFLVDNIAINAVTVDVLVTINQFPPAAGAATISADDIEDPGVLEIFAAAGRTVRFQVTDDLFFSGQNQPLLITFRGAGNLVFETAGGHSVNFSATVGSPAIFVTAMDSVAHTPLVNQVTFTRRPIGSQTPAELNEHALVTFDGGAFMTFADQVGGVDLGTVAFDGSNNVANVGRLILNIQNNSGVRIQGNVTSNAAFGPGGGAGPLGFELTDFNFAARAGASATMSLLTQGPAFYAPLVVTNFNEVLPELQANPWCEINQNLANQPGFILGQNGALNIPSNTYLDYIGCVMNRTPNPLIPAGILRGRPLTSVIKDRNPSALIVDGSSDEFAATRAQINIGAPAAMYFRSGVYFDPVTQTEVVIPLDPNSPFTDIWFAINPEYQLREDAGYGNIVFDVEAPVNVNGSGESALQILSWHVDGVGGSVFIENVDTIFPRRDFIVDGNGIPVQYNKGCFMINNRMNMISSAIQHMDTLHQVYEKNFPLQSEASYIGGESWLLCQDRRRPKIVLNNSAFLVQTDAAMTGVDLFVPEVDGEGGNNSTIVFYGNGRCVDNGVGRNLIMGTNIGALASDFGTILNRDAHMDAMQEFALTPATPQFLRWLNAYNNNKVLPNDPADELTIVGQYSVHDIFLGHASNISIGTPAAAGTDPVTGLPFVLTTNPDVQIAGTFIGVDTQGGTINNPAMSMSTGEGGIFVDNQGVFEVVDTNRAYIGAVVAKSFNGVIDLPRRQVLFQNRVGIANSALNLSDPAQLTIIGEDEVLSDYTLDWKNTVKDFCDETVFVPYDPVATPPACLAPAVTASNLQSLPRVFGNVDQFQIINSLLGDEAHIMFDNAEIREFIVLRNDEEPVSAAMAFVALQNDAELGLGTANRNIDSDEGQVFLGVNGITLCANGNAQVFLNQNILVDNVCHILKGPNFGFTQDEVPVPVLQRLQITSVVPQELRIKSGGVLDLTQFDDAVFNEVVIAGEVRLVFEPGSRLILGHAPLRITENAQVVFQSFFDAGRVPDGTLTYTDPFRVKISTNSTGDLGEGLTQWIFSENAQMVFQRGSLVGVESAGLVTVPDVQGGDQGPRPIVNCSYITRLNLKFIDNAKILVGSDSDFGGALQVGNTTDQALNGGSIDFTLTIGDLVLDSFGAGLVIGSQGFLGLGVGVVDKPSTTLVAPNNWRVANLFNVNAININVIEGTIQHNETFTGADDDASLIAIGNNVAGYNTNGLGFVNLATGGHVLGGGNIVQISGAAPVFPVVTTVDGVINGTLSAGILTSAPMTTDPSKTALSVPATATEFFNFIKQNDYGVQVTRRSTIARNSLGTLTIGYVLGSAIVREGIVGVIGTGGSYTSPDLSLAIGTAGLALDQNNISTTYTVAT